MVNSILLILLKEQRNITDIATHSMLKLDQIKNGHRESILMLILKNIQISQLESSILLIHLKEQKKITDIVIHLMPKLDQSRNGLKELITMLTHRNTQISQLEN
jgi:hypothetical protein